MKFDGEWIHRINRLPCTFIFVEHSFESRKYLVWQKLLLGNNFDTSGSKNWG